MKIRKKRVSREVGVEDSANAVEPSDSVPNPEEICARTEQKAALRDAIAKLKPTLRSVVELHDVCFYFVGISDDQLRTTDYHLSSSVRFTPLSSHGNAWNWNAGGPVQILIVICCD
jgi:hypothetical protein